ncbi:unnamed protein product, partial [marine sediment metagenome]
HDEVTLDELMNFVYVASKRKAGAADGFNDDTVMAMMFAYHGAKLYPCVRPAAEAKQETKKSEDPDTKKSWALFRKKLMTAGNKQGTIL